jgi:predicted TIM-barrel fold metal-dependent hydrolase
MDSSRKQTGGAEGRRRFLKQVTTGTALASVSAGMTGIAEGAEFKAPPIAVSRPGASSIYEDVHELIAQTPLVDTHEHLVDESRRVDTSKFSENFWLRPIFTGKDFSVLFSHYADADLKVAGMSSEALGKFSSPDTDLHEKWKLVSPYYDRTRNTGYLRNVRESIRILYGEEDINENNIESISNKLKSDIKPGYYRRMLNDVSNIEFCHVNCLDESVFMETEDPQLLCQDINFGNLCDWGVVAAELGREISTLQQWRDGIEAVFERYGPRSIAVKNAKAYSRKLNFKKVSADAVAPLVERKALGKDITWEESLTIEDHLFHFCIEQATAYNLPVKLHTGYYAGDSYMPLHRLRENAGDVCELLMAYPDTVFDIFHITYPYQHEAIAMAKHFPNAYIDMCWAWIIDPVGSVQFLKQFLTTAPASKVFTFGGDYVPVELVPGHASMTRQGLSQVLTELLQEGWLDESDVESLAVRIMNGNAHEIFDRERTLKNWPG